MTFPHAHLIGISDFTGYATPASSQILLDLPYTPTYTDVPWETPPDWRIAQPSIWVFGSKYYNLDYFPHLWSISKSYQLIQLIWNLPMPLNLLTADTTAVQATIVSHLEQL